MPPTTAAAAAPTRRFVPWAAKTPEIARRLVERYGEGQEPRKSADALQALLRRLRRVHYDWRQISDADRLDVAWVLWEGAPPPAEHEAFLFDFLAWLEAPQRRYQAARLALVWAAAFDPRLPSIRSVAAWLAAHQDLLPEPWPRLAADLDIFSIARAPRRIADAFFDCDDVADAFFARQRFPLRAVKGGLALETVAAAAAVVRECANADPRLALRLCALAAANKGLRGVDGAIVAPRLATIRAMVAEALLLPWEFPAPPREVKRAIATFLLELYGDVRVASAHWRGLDAPAATMRRWLTEETVIAYFASVRRAKAVDRDRLAEREQFWLANLGHVDDAWLLAGPANRSSTAIERLARGRLGGCRPDQVALLLKIGRLTILEASHEKSEIVWLDTNSFAPPLFRSEHEIYWLGALSRSADFSSAFGQRDNSTWQERLTRFIALHTAA